MSPTAMPHATNPDDPLQAGWRPAPQPPVLSATDESQAPPRPEKLSRRESRLGLRSIFSRNKTARHPDEPASPKGTNATQGIPYYTLPPGKPTARTRISRPLSTTIEDPEAAHDALTALADTPRRKAAHSQNKTSRGSGASHDAMPLFRAYPQAATYSTLPAATVSADVILRKAAENLAAPDAATGQGDDKGKPRRRHRRTKSGPGSESEWTTKTYILIGSGYLLEYAGEGPLDRLPEKVLRLGMNSAAFASDLIPGRHWVLQVASAMGSDGATVTDSNKSFFSRLPFRSSAEKKSASNMLLVFDSVEHMDEWLAALRRVIETLGGKKMLSETGKPKAGRGVTLRAQASQRTLVANKEYDRYSSVIPEDQPWEQDGRRQSDASLTVSETTRDQSIDDVSATNSVVSHDGQQLDSLRTSSNRLSCISSGQRTMVTSAGSSPTCSPTAESFPSPSEEPTGRHLDVGSADSRLRPNASAILERRKSLQTMNPFVELHPNAASQRPHSTLVGVSTASSTGDSGLLNGHNVSPNFSVPRSSSRRYSSARMPTVEAAAPLSPPREIEAPSRTLSRRPPTALRISRPLSMVIDQPSPRENVPERPATRHGESSKPSDEAELESLPPRPGSGLPSGGSSGPNPTPQSPPRQMGPHNSPRRFSSMGALRQNGNQYLRPSLMPSEPPKMRSLRSSWQPRVQNPERCHSSIDMYEHSTGLSPPPARAAKRASMLPSVPDQVPNSFFHEPPAAPPPSGPLPPVPTSNNNHLKPDTNTSSQALLNHKSMPQLVEGPPPAPPPTCALPPIPKKASEQNH